VHAFVCCCWLFFLCFLTAWLLSWPSSCICIFPLSLCFSFSLFIWLSDRLWLLTSCGWVGSVWTSRRVKRSVIAFLGASRVLLHSYVLCLSFHDVKQLLCSHFRLHLCSSEWRKIICVLFFRVDIFIRTIYSLLSFLLCNMKMKSNVLKMIPSWCHCRHKALNGNFTKVYASRTHLNYWEIW
jgi:hypothetical protein